MLPQFQQLLHDLQAKAVLFNLDSYSGVTVSMLNEYAKEHGPLYNPFFGYLPYFYIEEDLLMSIPLQVHHKEYVLPIISSVLGKWNDRNPKFSGNLLLASGQFNTEENLRMPDFCFIPRKKLLKKLERHQQWFYHKEPFSPTFVIEFTTLAGPFSQENFFDYKMKELYFKHGVELGWVIDHVNKIMIEYSKGYTRSVKVSKERYWRDLDAGEILPGLILYADALDEVFENRDPVAEEILEPMKCPFPNCDQMFNTSGKLAYHVDLHCSEMRKEKYLRRQERMKK